jgi:predicted dehydrogenase
MTIEGKNTAAARRRLRLGMVGGGQGAFIGAVHRMAARLDDRYDFVAGALASEPARARSSALELGVEPDRAYGSFAEMLAAETARPDRIDVVSIVTPNHMHVAPARAFLEAGIHVICDKPLTTTLEDAVALADIVKRSGLVFGLTHNYTGMPMVRQARDLLADGILGRVRVVQVEYPQDWLATKLEDTGQKQAAWRTDPARSGPAGALGDIGTHAYNLAAFVTGLACEAVAADLTTFVGGRRLDDNVNVMLRYEGDARGMLWASQVAVGNDNNLKLRVYGEKAGIEWRQEDPNYLSFAPLGEPPRRISRAGTGMTPSAARAIRIPAGHPEGYIEGFAQLYTDFAEQIGARIENRAPDPGSLLAPGIAEGVEGVRFISAVLESSRHNAAWVAIAR